MQNIVRYSLLAWAAYAIIWTWIIAHFISPWPAFVRVMCITLPEMLFFYLNLLIFIPRFLDKNETRKFFTLIGITIFVGTVGGGLVDIGLDRFYPFHELKGLERPFYTSFVARFFMTIMPLVVSSLISRAIQVRKQREESLELKNKMLEAETKALKAQINPHFLFNALNNIYALAQMKSDKTPDAVLHLSDILRYVTYDSNQNLVDLKDEIKTIESYIQLQALKDDNQSNIRIEIDRTNGHYKIAPLLLIPFIENSFKHSNHSNKLSGWIQLSINAQDNKIVLVVANSLGTETVKHDGKTHGLGLENVRKRLALIYPDRHQLTIKTDKEKYQVELQISLS